MSSPSRSSLPPPVRDRLLLAAALAAIAVTPWTVAHWPSQDGPNHLAIAHVLGHYGDPASPYPRYFEVQTGVRPSTLYYAVLVALGRVAPPEVAQKILVTFAALLLPLAGIAFTRRLVPRRAASALFLLPFAFDWALAMGFMSFVLALGFGVLALACAWEARAARLAAACALFFVCVLFHPVTGVLTGVALLLLEGPRLRTPAGLARVVAVTAPAAAFLVACWASAPGAAPAASMPVLTAWANPLDVACGFVEFHVAYSPWEILPRGALVLALGWLALRELRASFRRALAGADAESAVVRVVAGLVVLYALAPKVLFDWYYASARALLFASFLLPALVDLPARVARHAAAAAAALTALVWGLQVPELARLSGHIDEVLRAGALMRPGQKVIPLDFTDRQWGQIDKPQPLANAWAELVVDRDVVGSQIYAAGRPRMGGERFRTLSFRPGVLDGATGALPWSSFEEAADVVEACARRASPRCAEKLGERQATLARVADRYDYVLMVNPTADIRDALSGSLDLVRHDGAAWLYVPRGRRGQGARVDPDLAGRRVVDAAALERPR